MKIRNPIIALLALALLALATTGSHCGGPTNQARVNLMNTPVLEGQNLVAQPIGYFEQANFATPGDVCGVTFDVGPWPAGIGFLSVGAGNPANQCVLSVTAQGSGAQRFAYSCTLVAGSALPSDQTTALVNVNTGLDPAAPAGTVYNIPLTIVEKKVYDEFDVCVVDPDAVIVGVGGSIVVQAP